MATIDFIIQKAGGGTINLYNKNATTLSTITSAEQSQGLNSDDIVRITVESAVKIAFEIGDKINILGRWYKINRLPSVKKTGNRLFSYTIELEGVQYDLARAAYDLTIDTTNNELQDVQADMLTGNLERFARVLISNANRVFPGKWVLGEFPAGTEDKTLAFGETDNCLLVLQRLCTEYNTEFDITQAGDVNTINFRKAGQIFPYTFEYGKGKGLYSLERLNISTSNIVTRLKVYGGSRNITTKYRSARLCLPLKSKGQSFIEKTGPVNKYGIWEATKYFDHIYPKRAGKVTAIVAGDVLKLIDNTMNFDLNEKEADGITTKYLIEGVTAKIHFNTGNLSGYEFEIQGYDHVTKTFTLKTFEDERGERFPSSKSTAFQFGVNDEYVILDIALPKEYEDSSEAELQAEGDTFYDQNSQPKVQYSLEVSEDFLKELSGEGSITNIFSVGDYIPVKDTDIDVDKSVRIQSFTRDLLNPFSYKLNISDTVTTSITNRVISELIDIDNVTKINDIKNQIKARRDWRAAQELLGMVFDTEGDYYSEKIKPNSIETQMLSVGAKSTQFGLVGTVIQANYNGNKNSVNVKGGVLSHYTIAENGRDWNLANNTTTLIGDSTPYYIYAKCQKVGTGGSVIFSTEKITVEQDPLFYHFFVGIVNSVDPELNVRSVALTYGFTTVNGKFIRTGRIQSNDGNTYFDLDTGEIGGRITFRSTAGTDEDLAEILDGTAQDIQDTQAAANAAALKAQQAINDAEANVGLINTEVGKLQAQIDGEVSNWFYAYSPTLANYPASEWTTNAIKDRHIGDTFTSIAQAPATDAGKSWRFVKNGSVYSWTLIADSDAVLALQKAALAQSTADGKSTTYLIQPTKYKLGDMWVLNADQTVNGTAYKSGEILTATQDSATFNEAHWIKRVRYTDDSAVNNLEIGGRNLLIGSTDAWKTVNAYSYNPYIDIPFNETKLEVGQTYVFSWETELLSGSPTTATQVVLGAGVTSYLKDIIWTSRRIIGKQFRVFTPTEADLALGNSFILRWYTNNEVFSFRYRKLKLEKGNKPSADWTPAPEDVQASIETAKTEAENAAKTYANTKSEAERVLAEAYADGIVTAEEQARIDDVNNKLAAAKAYADAQDALLETQQKAYADGAISTAEQAAINAAKDYADLKKTEVQAYADGIVSDEEARAIADALDKFNASKAHAEQLVKDIEIGGRNLFSVNNFVADNKSRGYSTIEVIQHEGNIAYRSTNITNNHNIPRYLQGKFEANTQYYFKFNILWESFTNSGAQYVFRIIYTDGTTSNFYATTSHTYRALLTAANKTINYISTTRQYDGTVVIYNIQLEKANKPSDWRPAIEDVQSDINKAMADANLARAITDKFGTTIDGGLVNTVTVELREADTQDVTAGHTGIQGPLKNLPAYWAGGTYADALANLAKIIFRHDGSGQMVGGLIKWTEAGDLDIGNMEVDPSGALVIRDEEGTARLIITKDDVTPLADIGSSVQNTTINNTQLGFTYMLTGGVADYVQGNKIGVNNNNTNLSISTSISISISTSSGFKLSQGRGRAQVFLKKVGYSDKVLLGETTVQVDKLSGEASTSTSGVIPLSKNMLVSAGMYEIAAEVWMEATAGDHHLYNLSGTLGASTMVAKFDAANRRTEIGKNGIGIIVDANNYMCVVKEGNGFKVIARTNGLFDMPGVLAAGSVTAQGVQSNVWGAKSSPAGAGVISGGRSVPLTNMNHSNYVVQITPHTATTFRVGAKTTSSFQALGTGGFDYVVIGNNY